MFFKKFYTPQVDEMDCGVAALSMVLKYYGSFYSLADLRQKAKTNLDGTSIQGLVETAESMNFKTRSIKGDSKLFDIKDVPYPFIAHVLKNGRLPHYYVVVRVVRDSVYIADPDSNVGLTKLSKEKFLSEWTGISLFLLPAPDYKPIKKEKKHTLFSLLPILLEQKQIIIWITIASLLVALISILGSFFLERVIDVYIPNKMQSTISIFAVGLFAFYIFQSFFSYVQNLLLALLGKKLANRIILKYLKHVFELPMSFFSTRKTGEIVSRFNDANKIIELLANAIILVFLDIVVLFTIGTVLSFQNFTLFLITLAFVPIYMIIVAFFIRPFEKLNQSQMQSNAILNSGIIEDLHGIETIKSLTSENESYKKVETLFNDYLEKNFSYTKIDILQQSIKQLLQLSLTLIILWLGSLLVTKGQLSVGQLMAYNSLLVFFVNPLQSIINVQTQIQSAKVANNRLNEVYSVDSEFSGEKSYISPKKLMGDINFINVYYRYGFGKWVIKDFDLTIHKSEKVTIVGESGSGKSTLAKILIKFVIPAKGELTLNGINIKTISKRNLRQYINYIPQDPYTFSGTVMDNLKLGNRSGIRKEDIIEACKIAEIIKDIRKMPAQFKTYLDENGNVLSGGQKQRLAIARAILSPADVIVLDESTSGLDVITEKKLVKNLISLKNKTIIFIAHRLSIAKLTDTIVVLENGCVKESGSYSELMAKKGAYFQLEKNI